MRGGRSAAALVIMAVAVFGGCSTAPETEYDTVPDSASTQLPTKPPPSVKPSVAPKSDASCTNQINYAGDTRSNAEINSLGEQAGTCPAPRPYRADTSCTNWINYAGDPRANAEINSEGERTGSCPLPPS